MLFNCVDLENWKKYLKTDNRKLILRVLTSCWHEGIVIGILIVYEFKLSSFVVGYRIYFNLWIPFIREAIKCQEKQLLKMIKTVSIGVINNAINEGKGLWMLLPFKITITGCETVVGGLEELLKNLQ